MNGNVPGKSSPNSSNALAWFDWVVGLLWWMIRTVWIWLWWSVSARVAILVSWLASLVDVVVERSPVALRIFTYASIVVVMTFIIPLMWGVYRLLSRGKEPAVSRWLHTTEDFRPQMRQDWVQLIEGLGFRFAGCLKKELQIQPSVALFINSERRDSAHLARVAGKEFFVFKARYDDGFSFETSNIEGARLHPTYPTHPTFRFPQVPTLADLYRVHTCIRKRFEPPHQPIVSDAQGEIAEFISRAEVIRRDMFSNHYRLLTEENVYVFTAWGALHHAALLTWPVKPIRAALLRRRAGKELQKMGFRFDPGTDTLSEG